VIARPELCQHADDGTGQPAPALVWRFEREVRCVASTVLGGGIGVRRWVVNATVARDYEELDPEQHAVRIARSLGCEGDGAVLLTALDVGNVRVVEDEGATVAATTGLDVVTLAAAPDGAHDRWQPGTINVVASVPVSLADAALVNLVATVAEAKAQALADRRVPGTGTPSDAVVVCCPAAEIPDGEEHRYGGPRSLWGARIARACHAAVSAGIG
jgi:adenosylcobinamide amidohydrolase